MAITRKKGISLVVVAALAASIIVYIQYVRTPQTMLETKTVVIGDTKVLAEIAATPEQQEQGLSNRTTLKEGTGMLFVFAAPQVLSFWMKDMLFSIDIVWINSDGTVVGSEQRLSPQSYPTVFSSPSSAMYALEVPAGFVEEHAIAEGAKLVVQ